MVTTDELTDDEILERLQKILKNVNVVPHRVDEFDAAHPPLL